MLLRNLGAIRNLIKPSDNNPIDFGRMDQRADTLENKVLERWSKDPNALALAIRRGGL